MENSETKEQIINLGKLFLKELSYENENDLMIRWMAHYLAEKMKLVDQAEGTLKEAVEKECFNIILKLWERRWSLPPSRRPLRNFEPILDTLRKLSPDENDLFYPYGLDEVETEDDPAGEKVKHWLGIVKSVDETARVLIRYALNQAADNSENEDTKGWLYAGRNLDDLGDISAMWLFREKYGSLNEAVEDMDSASMLRQQKIELYKARIEDLQKFKGVYEEILKSYETQYKKASEE
ncbi:hypothetical protein [[Flexibacter] sp. ATCC 35208]|uniref:hypothetical protein n=1 Tax=[Flexibacter] sp. ATCC 35208 TaxID=1936242 RepID=UPI0009D16A59|nr:hypothetical protein [[Flexibacter] sp. ATCC 35208]OMP75286.1 hypothetical protein BW716_30875 [[Flexibacter] sp. ATCC 35208]